MFYFVSVSYHDVADHKLMLSCVIVKIYLAYKRKCAFVSSSSSVADLVSPDVDATVECDFCHSLLLVDYFNYLQTEVEFQVVLGALAQVFTVHGALFHSLILFLCSGHAVSSNLFVGHSFSFTVLVSFRLGKSL